MVRTLRCSKDGGCLAALRRLWLDQSATTSLEYALMLALVGLSAVAGYQSLGNTISHGVETGQEGVERVGVINSGSDAVGSVGRGGSAGGIAGSGAGPGPGAGGARGAASPG